MKALKEKCPEKFFNVSNTQLSIARYYGGIKVNGVRYIYNPIEDSLTRDDLFKKRRKKMTEEKEIFEITCPKCGYDWDQSDVGFVEACEAILTRCDCPECENVQGDEHE